jgi:hypothetical protein
MPTAAHSASEQSHLLPDRDHEPAYFGGGAGLFALDLAAFDAVQPKFK